jgi:cytidylate kinase
MPFRIAIAGDIGSGKTTIARRLAEAAGVEPLSTGGIQRRLAQARGLTVLELNKLAETDGTIDREIDGYLMNLPSGDLVVESRMAWHFVPDTLKVYLYVSRHQAVRRLLAEHRIGEDYRSISDPARQVLARRESEVLRFKKYYNVDIDDLRNYDVVIDTTFAAVEDIVQRIRNHTEGGNRPICWIDPRNLVPTRAIGEWRDDRLGDSGKGIVSSGLDGGSPLAVLYVDHVFYILHGHAQAAAAVRAGTRFVPGTIAASDDEPCIPGLSARQYVQDAVQDSLVFDWEDAVGFRYEEKIWKGRAETSERTDFKATSGTRPG